MVKEDMLLKLWLKILILLVQKRDNSQSSNQPNFNSQPVPSNFNNQPSTTDATTPYDFSATSASTGTNVSSDPYAEFGSNIEINDDELPF